MLGEYLLIFVCKLACKLGYQALIGCESLDFCISLVSREIFGNRTLGRGVSLGTLESDSVTARKHVVLVCRLCLKENVLYFALVCEIRLAEHLAEQIAELIGLGAERTCGNSYVGNCTAVLFSGSNADLERAKSALNLILKLESRGFFGIEIGECRADDGDFVELVRLNVGDVEEEVCVNDTLGIYIVEYRLTADNLLYLARYGIGLFGNIGYREGGKRCYNLVGLLASLPCEKLLVLALNFLNLLVAHRGEKCRKLLFLVFCTGSRESLVGEHNECAAVLVFEHHCFECALKAAVFNLRAYCL